MPSSFLSNPESVSKPSWFNPDWTVSLDALSGCSISSAGFSCSELEVLQALKKMTVKKQRNFFHHFNSISSFNFVKHIIHEGEEQANMEGN